jgi:hypothetical protein
MTANKVVEITFSDGPVVIRNHNGNPINANYDLWNDIVATEKFPPKAERGANYVLSLQKRVERGEEVRRVEQELIHALLRIASAWVFSGGAEIYVKAHTVVTSRRFGSNADAIEKEYLTEAGLTKVISDSGVSFEIVATYSRAPLALATKIAYLMEIDPVCRQLIEYYQQAVFDRKVSTSENQIWSYNLYKVRDVLSDAHGNGEAAKAALKICEKDWRKFGDLQNNKQQRNMRHAGPAGTTLTVSSEEERWLFQIARSWIAAFLRTKGIAEAAA